MYIQCITVRMHMYILRKYIRNLRFYLVWDQYLDRSIQYVHSEFHCNDGHCILPKYNYQYKYNWLYISCYISNTGYINIKKMFRESLKKLKNQKLFNWTEQYWEEIIKSEKLLNLNHFGKCRNFKNSPLLSRWVRALIC